MRNLFDGSRRGRRPDRPGSVPIDSSPYDFGTPDDERVDPLDLMAIRADDELLDALASGDASFGGYGSGGFESGDLDGGFRDDQQMLAMLAAWRDEVVDEPIPELLSTEQASEAIVAGQRSAYPKRRLMPVAAAAAAVVLGMSGVAIGAGAAEPGDALWGVSKTLDGDRAESKEAAQRVSVALASVQQALDQGRVNDAQATLASIVPELDKVTDEETKRQLSSKQANLTESAGDAEEGEKVSTDDSGKRKDGDKDRDKDRDKDKKSDKDSDKGDKDKDKTGTDKPDPRSADPAAGPDPRSQSSSPAPDPRREGKPSESSSPARPAPDTSSKPPPSKPSESKKPESSKPETTKPDQPKDNDKEKDKKGEGEGEGKPQTSTPTTATPNAMVPPVGPPAFGNP